MLESDAGSRDCRRVASDDERSFTTGSALKPGSPAVNVIDAASNPAEQLRLRLLGGFDIFVGGRLVPASAWRQRRAAAIVKLLALAPEYRLHREQLMEALWPDLALAAQSNNLRQMLHHARRQLEAAGLPKGLTLAREGDLVVLAHPSLIWVDVHAFEQAVAHSWRALSPATAQSAIALYAGDLLPADLYEEWTEPRRTALRAGFLALLTRLGQLHIEHGDLLAAIAAFQRLVDVEPTQEAAHVTLMQLYAHIGDRQLALAQFDQLSVILGRELDAEPDPRTQELATAIRSAPADAPAPAALASVRPDRITPPPGNLPTPMSELIGREREVAEGRQLLRAARLVTLTGTGGIGKTRLALAVASTLLEDFPDGVYFVDLAPLRDPALVLTTIAQAVDLREISGQALLATVADALRARRVLLVLDNFEHLADAAATVSELLERAGLVKALVTSRARLHVRGEREYRVPPLGVGDERRAGELPEGSQAPAVELFLLRALEADSEFRLSAESTPAVAAICHRLAGLPLAIELAAAQSRMLTPLEMLERLEDPLTFLHGTLHGMPARQQTMRSTIQWSYDLLGHADQHVFRCCSLFIGGWSLEAAEAVAHMGDAAVTFAHLRTLVEHNLIARQRLTSGETRFSMLETIREFGIELLSEHAEQTALRDRHAAFFVRLAEEAAHHLELSDQATWLARLDHDEDNLRAALDWTRQRASSELGLRLARALKLYWYMRGRLVEGHQQALAMARLPGSRALPVLSWAALDTAAFLARDFDDELAYEISLACLALSHRVQDRKRAADTLANLGYITLQQGKYDDAYGFSQRSLTTNRELGNQQGIADALSVLALIALHRGALDDARRLNEESLAIWIALEDQQGIVWARTHLGAVLFQQARYPEAYEQHRWSLRSSDELGFRPGLSWAFDGLAQLAAALSAADLAARLLAAAAAIREAAGIREALLAQRELDALLEQVSTAVGSAAFETIWLGRHQWSMTALSAELEVTLGALVGAQQ